MSNPTLQKLFEITKNRTDHLFNLYLNPSHSPAPILQEVMSYAVHNGGKRIRPLLVYATGVALETSYDDLDAPATAIELIHTYSLIHDDLPAMDNADLRRGKPSSHKAYNEALAILAGDALQPLAFQVLAGHPSHLNDQQRLAMIKVLTETSGMNGMIAGQVQDMQTADHYDALVTMHKLKTGALIHAAIKLAIIASNNQNSTIESALTIFAQKIGLAFQIQDDLLDIESDTETLGKPQGLDQTNHKITFPDVLGIENAKNKANALFSEAKSELNVLGEKGKILHEITDYIVQRKK